MEGAGQGRSERGLVSGRALDEDRAHAVFELLQVEGGPLRVRVVALRQRRVDRPHDPPARDELEVGDRSAPP